MWHAARRAGLRVGRDHNGLALRGVSWLEAVDL
jgi:hypothetical protein